MHQIQVERWYISERGGGGLVRGVVGIGERGGGGLVRGVVGDW